MNRRNFIGGSDAAAILGLSPWRSPMDVWMEKTGFAPERRSDPARDFLLDLGQQLEPVIARLYERETKRLLEFPVSGPQHPQYPVLAGTPDRLVTGEKRGVEIKSENQFSNEFGEPGTDQVPYHYLIQCAHYMAITAYPVWDVALLHGGSRFAIYTIERDAELEKDMIDQLLAWWDRHVVHDRPPDIDSSGAWSVYLAKKYPVNLLPIADADQQTIKWLEELEHIRIYAKLLEGLEEEHKNLLKAKIGEHDGLQGSFGKVTWKKTKDWTSVDWQAAFDLMCQRYKLPKGPKEDMVKMFTFSRPGSRRFLFSPSKEWKGLNDGAGIEAATREIARSLARPSLAATVTAGDRERSSGGTGKSTD